MQTQTKTNARRNGARLEVKTETGRWQQPEAIELKSASATGQTFSFFQNLILPERGVPFSPLND